MDKWIKVGVAAQLGCLLLEAWTVVSPYLGRLRGASVTAHPSLAVYALIVSSALWVIGIILLKWVPQTPLRPPALTPASPEPVELAPGAMPLPAPKLKIRIIDAVVGTERAGQHQNERTILLCLRVVNRSEPAVTVKGWTLQLQYSKPERRTAYCQKMEKTAFDRPDFSSPTGFKREIVDVDLNDRVKETPLDMGVAVEGWLKFTVHIPYVEHIFGATFALIAADDLDGRSACEKAPGD